MTGSTGQYETHTGGGRKLRRLRHLRHASPGDLSSPYWRATRRLAVGVVVTWAIVALALPLASEQLDAVSIMGIPLGYHFGAQLGLIVIAVLMLLATRRQHRHDRNFAGEHRLPLPDAATPSRQPAEAQ